MKKLSFFLHSSVMLFLFMLLSLPTWGIFNPVDYHLYPDNMSIVIQLKNGEQTIDTCEVAAFIGDECRGATRAIKGLYYLIVAGEGSGQKIEICTCIDNEILTIDNSMVYANDQTIGSPWEPYVIDLSDIIKNIRLKGDTNGDGAVDVADIAFIISFMANGTVGADLTRADVNGDGTVDVADIASVISIMAEKARVQK